MPTRKTFSQVTSLQGGEDPQDPLSLYVIFRKSDLYLVALFVENDVQLRGSYESWPPCTKCTQSHAYRANVDIY